MKEISNENKMKVVFGTMTFGRGDGGRIEDRSEMLEILKVFQSHGGVELDTARMYCDGNTEQVLAELKVEDLGYSVSTKVFPFKSGDHEPVKLRQQLQESLDALQTQKVDIFYLHAPDKATKFEDTLLEVNKLYQEGKFVRFGLSNYSSWQVMEIYKICQEKSYVLPSVYQGRYSIMTRDVEAELFPCLRKLNIAFYAYNPLCGGFLTGKLKPESQPEGRFDSQTIQGKRYRERYWKDNYFQAVDWYVKACQEHSLSPVEVALRWVSFHSFLDVKKGDAVIIGASSLAHVKQNLEFCEKDGPLPDTLSETLEKCWHHVQPVVPRYFR